MYFVNCSWNFRNNNKLVETTWLYEIIHNQKK